MGTTEQLSRLVPMNSLSESNLNELLSVTSFEDVKRDNIIFKEGDNDGNAIYLLEGEVELKCDSGDIKTKIVKGGEESANYALSQLKPRQYNGRTLLDSRIARIDSAELDRLLSVDQLSTDFVDDDGYEVSEMGADIDAEWMMKMLNQPVFKQLPAENISEVFNRLEEVAYEQGEQIIKQGESGDYYYIIKSGKFNVSRKYTSGKVQILANLNEGDVFGEESLLSDLPRNASVVALTEGTLMRLAKTDFQELLPRPLIKTVQQKEAEKMLAKGAGLLDVRMEDEFKRGALKVAKNVPLYLLRRYLKDLDQAKPYVLCCQTGARSAVGAFLMNQRGYDVCVLEGGLQGLKKGSPVS